MSNILRGIINAFAEYAYIWLVAWVMLNGEKFFGEMNNLVSGVSFLMLFVLSAAISVTLLLTGPVLVYLNKDKKGAIQMLIWTIGTLAIITFATLLIVVFI